MTRTLSRRSVVRALGAALAGTALGSINVVEPSVARARRRLADEPTGLDANVWAATMGPIAETAQDLPPRVYVPHEPANRLDFYDPGEWRAVARLPIPASGVDHLDFSADGSYLMVTGEFGGQLVKVDVERMAVAGVVRGGGP